MLFSHSWCCGTKWNQPNKCSEQWKVQGVQSYVSPQGEHYLGCLKNQRSLIPEKIDSKELFTDTEVSNCFGVYLA